MTFYGKVRQTGLHNWVEANVEEIRVNGYTVIEKAIPADGLRTYREAIDASYALQEAEFGRDALMAIDEEDICRFCMKYDERFLGLAGSPTVMRIVKSLLGDYFILNLQNAILNRPDTTHHQSAWHRDLPYMSGICAEPVAISALVAIDDFTDVTGGTVVLVGSHGRFDLPSDEFIEKNQQTVFVKAGGVIVFDSMLFHRAGNNTSNAIRRGVNHMYTLPFIKQQYNIGSVYEQSKLNDSFLQMLLGASSATPEDDVQWRRQRLEKARK